MFWTIIAAVASFVLGCLACRIFYFIRSGKTAIVVLKVAQIIYLTMLMRCIEDWYYSHTIKLESLRKSGVEYGDEMYVQTKKDHEERLSEFKRRSINFMIDAHPGLFKEAIEFKDWREAMKFLEKNKQMAILFTKGLNQ
jgi:hypothetical protein